MPVLPYTCVYIDADWRDLLFSASQCINRTANREPIVKELQAMWSNPTNQNSVLPCLSVRSGLDLYLKVKDYPPGSEVIMSAINIPDMVYIVKHHKLKVVPFDVSIETTGPKVELLESLITDKTVAILIAHIYGKWCDIEAIIDIAQRKNIYVIEDCAECFCGFERTGNPRSDLALFSFGVIKYSTAFGGAIAKIKDQKLYAQMRETYLKYPIQKHSEYLKKILKYSGVYILLDCPSIIKPLMVLTRTLSIDHKKVVIKLLRGFPDRMIERIRAQPSNALLATMKRRLDNFDQTDFNASQVKAEYVKERLPEEVTMVGMQAEVNNYWLFPILMDNPDTVVKILNAMGIDAYRGATQLNLIEPENCSVELHNQHATSASSFDDMHKDGNQNYPYEALNRSYPHEARYLINHVVYLPVNKSVPFHVLDQICKCVQLAIRLSKNGRSPDVRLHAKL
ncbi:uncharacterized protein LOC110449309 [Mizuhopecten yessoensis]|uniref:UDP-4-amino-4-deoxy-L-arabinose--oxoglutarate aminotransferase n=1 Tax=Mizuhopecten yessoensis TaxID=6573 RepID=A0A210QRJ8_MIZYE|nr:uncharacterized protein LOC110449309 [Mizuhopecten yessoensis]XP_021351754.1 uncharacterized protein LOC110449309 [Mizuhopecten yessoensis]OWF51339.1 UDP-4-amino-4-deoxy-L-arabinose--oxoglutarate aminotransferase [Mizuhopecten yessoensis]